VPVLLLAVVLGITLSVVVVIVVVVVTTQLKNHSDKPIIPELLNNVSLLREIQTFLCLLHCRRGQNISLRQQHSLPGLYHVTRQKTAFISVTTVKSSISHIFTVIKSGHIMSQLNPFHTHIHYLLKFSSIALLYAINA
jgi:hypothetical protein